MGKKEQRSFYLETIPKTYLKTPKKIGIYDIFFGNEPNKIKSHPCFAHLWSLVQDNKTLYFVLDKTSKDKIKYFATIKSIKNLFNDKFDIDATNINKNKIVIKIRTKKDFNENFTQAGFMLIGVLLRSIDTEYNPQINSLKLDGPITNIETLVLKLSKTSLAHQGHAISSSITDEASATKFLNDIRLIFGTKKYNLKHKTLGNKFTTEYRQYNMLGYDFAYKLLQVALKKKPK